MKNNWRVHVYAGMFGLVLVFLLNPLQAEHQCSPHCTSKGCFMAVAKQLGAGQCCWAIGREARVALMHSAAEVAEEPPEQIMPNRAGKGVEWNGATI